MYASIVSVAVVHALNLNTSDRDQIQIEPFSPGHNVVVGRNGSGKSNFFAGISSLFYTEIYYVLKTFLSLSYSFRPIRRLHINVKRRTPVSVA